MTLNQVVIQIRVVPWCCYIRESLPVFNLKTVKIKEKHGKQLLLQFGC